MRRAVVLCLVTAVVGGVVASLPASGAAQGPSAYRKASANYTMAGGVSLGTPATVQTTSAPTASDKARSDEDRVTITVKDTQSSVVALAIRVTPAGGAPTTSLACNTATLPVRSGTLVEVTPVAGLCPDGKNSIPRTGTIVMTWHRYLPLPAKSTPKSAAPSQRFAVLIGIRDYAGGTHDTIGGTGDVTVIRAALISSGWQSGNIRMVTDKAATATGIRNAFAWLAARSTAKSFSLLHFSGHVCISSRGACPSGHTYLWSHDNKFIPETEVVSRMKAVKGFQWLDIAGCQSGAFNAGYSASNRMFTASSRPTETSYEEPRWGQSVWTGLAWDRGYRQGRAAPSGRGHTATISQLASYGIRETASYTSQQKAGVQHPVIAGGSSSWSLRTPPGG